MARFTLEFGGDAQGEPPRIYILDKGQQFAELFLEPIQLVEDPDSFDDDHWEFPLIAKSTVWLMNEYS